MWLNKHWYWKPCWVKMKISLPENDVDGTLTEKFIEQRLNTWSNYAGIVTKIVCISNNFATA